MYSKLKRHWKHVETIPNTNKYGVFFQSPVIKLYAGQVIRYEPILSKIKREEIRTAQKPFPLNIPSVNAAKSQFTEEIFKWKLHFLWSDIKAAFKGTWSKNAFIVSFYHCTIIIFFPLV